MRCCPRLRLTHFRRSRQGQMRQRGRCKGKGSIGSFSSWWRPPCLPMTSRRRGLLEPLVYVAIRKRGGCRCVLCGDTSVHRLWPLSGRVPTGSLLIDMPQLVLPGSLERWAMCPMFGALGAWGGTARHRLFHVAQQLPGRGRIDLAVTKAKPRKVERCSVKNADSKCLMDRRFVRTVGPRWRVAPRRRLRALVLPLPRA